jgi:hypothetical protein
VNKPARSNPGARRLAASNHVASRQYGLYAVCPAQELRRWLQNTKATASLRDTKIAGWNAWPLSTSALSTWPSNT